MSTKKESLQNVRHINTQQALDSSVRYIMVEPGHEDDINLFDIWLVIVKRRFLLLFVILLCFLAGVLFALTSPVKYSWSTAIEIGTGDYDKTGVLRPIEAPSGVLAKLQQSYIPLETKKIIDIMPGVPEVNAKLDKNSNIIFLDIKGVEENRSMYTDLLNSVVARIKQDHVRISALKRKDLELSLSRAENEIIRLKDHEQLLVSQYSRLDKKQALLEARISETRKLLAASTETRQKVIKAPSSESRILLLMRVDSELRAHRDLLASLDKQLQIELENTREMMKIRLTENRQQQLEKKAVVERKRFQLGNLLETRAIIEPIQSQKPVSRSQKLVIVVSLVAGLFLGVFVVFMAEFFEKARAYSAEHKLRQAQ
ncbi:hypothetical protein MNBD_GAMMA11-1486 [hydrothermal vent metagenome]|uniref:Polysaccharide chain length determinant N-terminal domain-containing protein n=1 Tax=hydrothermal vent metagenome TaxID=652676 RepID=A0A3B0X5U3_9ZZZZ